MKLSQLFVFATTFLGSLPRVAAQTGTIKARVWNDLDGDGKQDSSESEENIEGVTVELLDANASDALLQVNTTDANGIAAFSNVNASKDLKLRFVPPDSYKFTLRDVGRDDNIDSDADPTTGKTEPFNIADGETFEKVDAGMWAPGSVDARVWNDLNGDGEQDGSESDANIPNVTVKLYAAPEAGEPEKLLGTTTTNDSGIASFANVPADRGLFLEFVKLEYYKFTKLNEGDKKDKDSDADPNNKGRTAVFFATKGSQVHNTMDAGMFAPGKVEAKVWNDLDGDGKQGKDESKEGIENVAVSLYAVDPVTGSEELWGTAMTDMSGIAVFENVPADRELFVRFEPLVFYKLAEANEGGREGTASAADPENMGRTGKFFATEGSQIHTTAAAMFAPGAVKARVWNDLNGNGEQDGSESDANIQGVTVRLYSGDPVAGPANLLDAVLTDGSGIATFENVPADRDLFLEFVKPEYFGFTKYDKGSKEDMVSDADPDNKGRTAVFFSTKGSQLHNTMDGGMLAPGTVEARVWNDVDGDGKQGKHEDKENIEDITVKLYSVDPDTGSEELWDTNTTDASGIATFDNVPADRDLYLQFMKPKFYKFTKMKEGDKDEDDSDANPGTNGRTAPFSATEGCQLHDYVDAGMWAPGTAKAMVWNDLNGDGTQDDGCAGIPEVTVRLLDASSGDAVMDTRKTNGDGIAEFPFVPADRNVRLQFDLLPFNAFTLDNKGSDDKKDSDADRTSGLTPMFAATKGSELHDGMDAGFWGPGTVETKVWYDDGDGEQEGNEAGVEGVVVHLLEENGDPVCLKGTTNSDGVVTIPCVPADRPVKLKYENLQNGMVFTLVNNDVNGSDIGMGDGTTATFMAVKGGEVHTKWDATLAGMRRMLRFLNPMN